MLEGEADADADADVARVLARSLVMQRIEGNREWESIMSELGIRTAEGGTHAELAAAVQHVEMDSVKRKRRKKMNKHKYVFFLSFVL